MQDILIALGISMLFNFIQVALTCYLMFGYILYRDKGRKHEAKN